MTRIDAIRARLDADPLSLDRDDELERVLAALPEGWGLGIGLFTESASLDGWHATAVPDFGGPPVTGHGPTLEAALASLADQLEAK